MIAIPEVERRLSSLGRYGQRLDEATRLSADAFGTDERLAVATERYLQLAAECCIEIGLLLIAGLRLKQPDSYEQIGTILAGAGFGQDEAAGQFERLVRVRNQLIHGYSGLDPVALHQQLAPRLVELQLFAKQTVTFIRKHE